MSENKFLVIGFGNMGSLHVKILTTLIPTVRFDIVDDQEIKIPQNCTKINFELWVGILHSSNPEISIN